MSYVISPPQETKWRFDNDVFIELVNRHWPDAEVQSRRMVQEAYAHGWVIGAGDDRVEGKLHRDGRSILLDGSIERCAAFAIWVRVFVPSEQELLFYDDEFSAEVRIEPDTTEEDLARAFEEGRDAAGEDDDEG